MRKSWLIAAIVGVVFLFLSAQRLLALDVPPAPAVNRPVVDQTGILTVEEVNAISQVIDAERVSTGNEIGVLLINSLETDSLEDFSLKVARTWGIGQKDKNNGVLLLVAVNDRKLRIEVGYGLEGALPDARAAQIIRDRITPAFRTGDYYKGLYDGLTGIILAIHGESDPNLKGNSIWGKIGEFFWVFFYGLFILPLWVSAIFARTKSWYAGGIVGILVGVVVGLIWGFVLEGILAIVGFGVLGALFDYLVSKNYKLRKKNGKSPSWWAGGSSIGSSSGSSHGSSFGGGSFGGGGSSGSW